VRIPKLGGVRKGWMRQYAIICDFKLFVHNVQADTPKMTVTHLFDIKLDKCVCICVCSGMYRMLSGTITWWT